MRTPTTRPVIAPVHAWRNPPKDGRDTLCLARAYSLHITALRRAVTCPDCLDRMEADELPEEVVE